MRPDLARPVVAIMQPTFLPWQGYFAMIAMADIFVFLDDVQFVRRSFHHRNRLFANGAAVDWVTLPVEDVGRDVTLDRVRPQLTPAFARKYKARLHANYARAPFYDAFVPLLTGWVDEPRDAALAERNISLIREIARCLDFAPDFQRSSGFGIGAARSRKLTGLLEATGAATYLSADGSFDYMQEEGLFPDPRFTTVFHRFSPQPHPQFQSTRFAERLSIADALFQVGAETTRALVLAGIESPATWDERAARQVFAEAGR